MANNTCPGCGATVPGGDQPVYKCPSCGLVFEPLKKSEGHSPRWDPANPVPAEAFYSDAAVLDLVLSELPPEHRDKVNKKVADYIMDTVREKVASDNPTVFHPINCVSHTMNGVTFTFLKKAFLTTLLEYERSIEGVDDSTVREMLMLDTEMESALEVQRKLASGETRTINALMWMVENKNKFQWASLGWDFMRESPKIEVHIRAD